VKGVSNPFSMLWSFAKVDDAALDGEDGGAGAVLCAEFLQDFPDMELYQRLGKIEGIGDFLVRPTPIRICDFLMDLRRQQAGRPASETAGTAILLFTNLDARKYSKTVNDEAVTA